METLKIGRLYLQLITLIVCLLGISSVGYSVETTIKKIDEGKKTVVINGTSADGFEKGNKVCFYNPESLKRVACGTIKKSGKLTSVVKVSDKAIKKIKMSHTVSTYTDKMLSVSGETQNPEEATVFNRKKNMFRVNAFYAYSPMSSAKINAVKLKGVDSSLQGSMDSLWEDVSKENLTSVPAIFGGSFSYNINELFSLTLGGSVHLMSLSPVLSDYEISNKKTYTYTEQNPSAFSLFFDFTAYRKYLGVTGNNINFIVGLLYENFSSEFKSYFGTVAENATDNSRNKSSEVLMASVDSSLSVIGARLGAGFDMAINQMFAINATLITIIPISGTPSYTTKVEEELDNLKDFLKDQNNLTKDLEESMGIDKSFGLEISIGASVSF